MDAILKTLVQFKEYGAVAIIAMALVGYIVWQNYILSKKEKCKDANCFSEQSQILKSILVQLEKNNKLIQISLMEGLSEDDRSTIIRILEK